MIFEIVATYILLQCIKSLAWLIGRRRDVLYYVAKPRL